jgi:hypothetical protein
MDQDNTEGLQQIHGPIECESFEFKIRLVSVVVGIFSSFNKLLGYRV